MKSNAISDKTLKSAGYLEKHISSVHRVQMKVVKTIEGHIGLFPSTELQKICTAVFVTKQHVLQNWRDTWHNTAICSLESRRRHFLALLTSVLSNALVKTLCNFLPERHYVISCLRGCAVTLVAFTWLFYAVCIWCVLKLPCGEDAKSHRLHLFDFSPLCVFKCVLKLPAWEDA